jgi:hypothetical protein
VSPPPPLQPHGRSNASRFRERSRPCALGRVRDVTHQALPQYPVKRAVSCRCRPTPIDVEALQLQKLDVATMSETARQRARETFEARWNRWNAIRTCGPVLFPFSCSSSFSEHEEPSILFSDRDMTDVRHALPLPCTPVWSRSLGGGRSAPGIQPASSTAQPRSIGFGSGWHRGSLPSIGATA